MKAHILCLCLCYAIKIPAQMGYHLVMGGRNAGIAGCGVALQKEAHAIFYNPASLTSLYTPTAIVASDVRFTVSNLKPIGIGFIQPTHSGVFGVSVQHLGFDVLQQQKIGVAFGRRLMENLSLGIQLDYLRWAVNDYPTAHALTFEIGCNTTLFKDVTLATHLYNPLRVRLSGGERTPSVFKMGVAWQALPNFLLTAEAEQSTHHNPSFRFGFDYQLTPAFAARLGMGANPTAYSFGVGYRLTQRLSVDVAMYQHLLLGSTPALSVVYAFGKVKDVSNTPPQ
jgi:hypothetical protein